MHVFFSDICPLLSERCRKFHSTKWTSLSAECRNVTIAPHPENSDRFLTCISQGGRNHICDCGCLRPTRSDTLSLRHWRSRISNISRRVRLPRHTGTALNVSISLLLPGLNMASQTLSFPPQICNITASSKLHNERGALEHADQPVSAFKSHIITYMRRNGNQGPALKTAEPCKSSSCSRRNLLHSPKSGLEQYGFAKPGRNLIQSNHTESELGISRYATGDQVHINLLEARKRTRGTQVPQEHNRDVPLPLVIYDNSPMTGSAVALVMILIVIIMVVIILAKYSK